MAGQKFRNDAFSWTWIAVVLCVLAASAYFAWNGSALGTVVANAGVAIFAAFFAFLISLKRAKSAFSTTAFLKLLFGLVCLGGFAVMAYIVSPMVRNAVLDNLNYLSTVMLFIFAGLAVYFEYLELE